MFSESYPNGRTSFFEQLPTANHSHHLFQDHNLILGISVTQQRREAIPCSANDLLPSHAGCFTGSIVSNSDGDIWTQYPRQNFLQKYCRKTNVTDMTPINSTLLKSVNVSLCDAEGLRLLNKHNSSLTFSNPWPEGSGFNVYIHPSLNVAKAEEQVDFLETMGWVDDRTAEIKVRTVLYNLPTNLVSLNTLVFSFTVGGIINTNIQTLTIDPFVYATSTDRFRLALEIVWIILLGIHILIEVMIFLKSKHKQRFFMQISNQMGLAFIALAMTSLSLWIIRLSLVNDFNAAVKLSHYHFDEKQDLGMFESDIISVIRTGSVVAQVTLCYLYVNMAMVFLLLLRSFSRLNFHSHLSLFNRTMSNAGHALVHFVPIVIYCCLGFSIIGYMTFGHRVEGWSTISNSVISSFRLLLGVGDFSDTYDAQGGISAGQGLVILFYIFFYIWVVLILISMFLAIVLDSYAEARRAIEGAPSFMSDMKTVASDMYSRVKPKKSKSGQLDRSMKKLIKSGKLSSRQQVDLSELADLLNQASNVKDKSKRDELTEEVLETLLMKYTAKNNAVVRTGSTVSSTNFNPQSSSHGNTTLIATSSYANMAQAALAALNTQSRSVSGPHAIRPSHDSPRGVSSSISPPMSPPTTRSRTPSPTPKGESDGNMSASVNNVRKRVGAVRFRDSPAGTPTAQSELPSQRSPDPPSAPSSPPNPGRPAATAAPSRGKDDLVVEVSYEDILLQERIHSQRL
mmetsp:Transcript_42531/g.70801  ORF Transcript_42531/g.70801 Transcript_42531/m.70801 type:complete len:738 (-) Transcript_42531:490-2703(-)